MDKGQPSGKQQPYQQPYQNQQQPQPQYPMHGQYNQPQPGYNQYPQNPYPGAGPMAPPPPAYYASQAYGGPPQYQQAPGYAGGNMASYPYPASQPAPPMYTQPQTGTTVMMKNMYDPGARFDSTAQRNIPPPPPGCPPNSAQMAAMQGHSVVGTQKKSNMFWGNSSDGGWTW